MKTLILDPKQTCIDYALTDGETVLTRGTVPDFDAAQKLAAEQQITGVICDESYRTVEAQWFASAYKWQLVRVSKKLTAWAERVRLYTLAFPDGL